MNFYSQLGQDKFLYQNYFKNKRDGFFVELGAYDGVKYSNCFFFEKFLGWNGICVEPIPKQFRKLQSNRTSTCVNSAVSNKTGTARFLCANVEVDEEMLSGLIDSYDPKHLERISSSLVQKEEIEVELTTFNALLDQQGVNHVDYCSIDTEGSELEILKAIDFSTYSVDFFSIENNYGDTEIRSFLESNGYDLVHSFHGYDELYKKSEIQKLATTTIFSFVKHSKQNIEISLKGHQDNLDKLTSPIECVYVFDGGMSAPGWLKGKILETNISLNVYEAWNLAISAVRTPFIMNLNLGDRLNADSIEVLEEALNSGLELVGGDWKICYSQEDADDTDHCHSARDLPFLETGLSVAGTATRLGSGTGERQTFGPSCLWRIELHQHLPRYPYRFADTSYIEEVGDVIFWAHLQKKGCRLGRIPTIIGNCNAHIEGFADSRLRSDEELQKVMTLGVSLF